MSDSSGASPQVQRNVLTIVFLTVFLDLIGFGIILPLLPLYVQSMGGSAQTVGFLLTSFSITQLITTPMLGRLSDRYGRRRIILISLFGNAVAMVVFALSTYLTLLPLLFLSRMVAGATAGNLSACQAAIADVTSREDRAKGMGRLGAGIGLGMVLGPVLGSALSHFGGWAPPLAAALMALIDLGLAWFLMPETRGIGSRSSESGASAGEGGATAAAGGVAGGASVGVGAATAGAPGGGPAAGTPAGGGDGGTTRPSIWVTLSERRTATILLLYFLTFLGLTNLQVAFALLTRERLHWGETEVGYLFGLFGLVMLVVQGGLLGRLARAFGEINLVLAGSLSSGVGFLLIALAYDPHRLIAGCLLFAFGNGVTNPSLSSLASRYAPRDQQGAVLGFAQSAGGLARAIGPTWAGFLYTRLGPGSPFLWSVGVALVAFTVAFSLKRLGEVPGSAAASAPAQRAGA